MKRGASLEVPLLVASNQVISSEVMELDEACYKHVILEKRVV